MFRLGACFAKGAILNPFAHDLKASTRRVRLRTVALNGQVNSENKRPE